MDIKINPNIKPLSATLKRLNIGKSFRLKDFQYELEEKNIDDFWLFCANQSGYVINMLTSNLEEKLTNIFTIGLSVLYDKYINFNGINNQNNFNEFLKTGLNFYIKNNSENSDYTKLLSELEKIKIIYTSTLNEFKELIIIEKNRKKFNDDLIHIVNTTKKLKEKINPTKNLDGNRKYQVFISSTFTDLIEERQAAVQAILKKGHIPAGMELFTAGDKSQWNVIEKWIDDSDIYVLLLGGRYGSIDKETDLSYTEMEYDYAIKKKKPFFTLILNDNFLDSKSEKIKNEYELENSKYKKFKERVSNFMCSFPNNNDQIQLHIVNSLDSLISDNKEKMQGWIKGKI